MVRVLIADDHPIVRTGLRQILVDEPDIEVAGEAQNGGEVIDFLWKNACDLVLLDIGMPGRSGLEIISETVSYTHLRAHATPEHLLFRLLLAKKNSCAPAHRIHFPPMSRDGYQPHWTG